MSHKNKQLLEEFYIICGDIDLANPTLLQQKTPVLLSDAYQRDTIVEAVSADGAGLAAIISSILITHKRKSVKSVRPKEPEVSAAEPSVLVLMNSDEILNNAQYFHQFSSEKSESRRCLSHAVIGDKDNAKRDLKALYARPEVIISTPDRIIDHVRRDNLILNAVTKVIIVRPQSSTDNIDSSEMENEAAEEKEKKTFQSAEQKHQNNTELSRRTSAAEAAAVEGNTAVSEFSEIEASPSEAILSFDHDVLFISSKIPRHPTVHLFTPDAEQTNNLHELVKRPKIIRREDWDSSRKAIWIQTVNVLEPQEALNIIYAHAYDKGIIICADNAQKEDLSAHINQSFLHINFSVYTISESISMHFDGPVSVIVYGIPDISSQSRRKAFLKLFNTINVSEFIFILTQSNRSRFKILQENYTMDEPKETKHSPEEVFAGKLKMLTEQVRLDKNPEELNKIKKLMKKNVPFHLRSYLFAYLLREAMGNIDSEYENRSKKDKSKPADPDAATLFVSIGKKRRVYPKDLAKLFKANLELSNEEIGSIRVLDNYSFISISKDKAQDAIEKMDGIKFRGRNITVNFAKKKQG